MRTAPAGLALAGMALATATLTAIPARAEVAASADSGFVVTGSTDLAAASPAQVWATLVQPGQWWSDAHSWSGSAANMTLEPVAGGCFCETIPGEQPGSVEHMRVIHARPQTTLVMRGSLGPLQGEALVGTLTITLEPLGEGGSRMAWSYVVGGYARFPLAQVAPAVDGVLAEQMGRLAAHLGGG